MMVLVALFGGLGAACRFLVDGLLTTWLRPRFPLGTLLINIAGSLMLGLLVGWSHGSAGQTSQDLARVLGTGWCGGFTTFSTASVDAVRLTWERSRVAGVSYAAGTAVAACLAAAMGIWVGQRG